MSARPIREVDGQRILVRQMLISGFAANHAENDYVQVAPQTELSKLPQEFPWLLEKRLVCKPDQLLKRRGKAGLLCLDATWDQVIVWLEEHRGKTVSCGNTSGILDHFLIVPFVPHEPSDEYYLAIIANRHGDEIVFHSQGGVDVGDVDSKAKRLLVPIMEQVDAATIHSALLKDVPDARRDALARWIAELFRLYSLMHFTYLEINPLVMTEYLTIWPLDLAAKVDETARFICRKYWGELVCPSPFGHRASPEEEFIASLDEKTGASLKLTVLNPKGRIWLMVAGGGASVIYSDTVADLGAGAELANYGEYSGDPTEDLTFEYASTILRLMTLESHPDGKFLIIGGGIANFTDVAATFKGIIRALEKYGALLAEQNVRIFVRRGGPNYQEGLKMMRETATRLSLEIHVHGPETHVTSVVALALGKKVAAANMGKLCVDSDPLQQSMTAAETGGSPLFPSGLTPICHGPTLFNRETRCIIYGMQPGACQNMLDFDYISQREKPSVASLVYPFASGLHHRQFYWSSVEVMIPVHHRLDLCLQQFPEVDVVVNFASSRSAYESTLDILKFPQIRCIIIIAEGVPEKHTRHLLRLAKENNVVIIGPATVGGIKPGSFRIGNSGGRLDNIVASRLHRPGSVAYVSRSGGLSNELNNIISRCTDGVCEGIAIGGDRFPISDYMDHLKRFQNDDSVKLLVMLGEVGGTLEYDVCAALRDGTITKPLVAWCTGTVAKHFPYDVQFGHAGALAQATQETADAKNAALREAGALVPESFEDFSILIGKTFQDLVGKGLVLKPDISPPPIPVDYAWARKLGLIRKPPGFISTISDDRGGELSYAGMPISKVFSEEMGIGGVVGLLWFRRRLPPWATKFIEIVLQMTADHGPAVSGAHNTIVTARAGKDLISSLTSGLLTIGPRFGGALDGAAGMFCSAFDRGLSPEEFVEHNRRENRLIQGIGHLVKSLENPDARVSLIREFVHKSFPSHPLMDYAFEVQKVTTRKKSNLILNVDGAIACAFVDLLRSCGMFTHEEATEYVEMGALNGLFVLGRSIGFIGHYLDQKRLKQGLYRHPTDDIAYMLGQSL